MNRVTLGELLTEQQCSDIWGIIEQETDSIVRVRKLKEYLGNLREELEAKGVLPEYLAYVLEAKVTGVI